MGCVTFCFRTGLDINPILLFNMGFSHPTLLLSYICKLYLHKNLENSTYECIFLFEYAVLRKRAKNFLQYLNTCDGIEISLPQY